MQVNEHLWDQFKYHYEPMQCNNSKEEKEFLDMCKERLGIKTFTKFVFQPFPHIFIYDTKIDDLLLSHLNHNNIILFSTLYGYDTWEIIKMHQEGDLDNNDIIIGKNLKRKLLDIRTNFSVEDLLVNEPFAIHKRESNKDIENKKHIKKLLNDLTETINKII